MATFITLLIIIPSACILFKTNVFSRSWCLHFRPSREQLFTPTHQHRYRKCLTFSKREPGVTGDKKFIPTITICTKKHRFVHY